MSFLPGPDVARLARSSPPLGELDRDRLVWRIYFSGGTHPVAWNEFRFFGPVAARFDHHDVQSKGPSVQDRGVYYCAPDLRTVIAETFQTKRLVPVGTDGPRLVGWFPGGVIGLLNLTSEWTTRAGCDQRIHTTPSRRSTQSWSRAIYEAFPAVGGLRYRSKYSGRISWCLYERSRHLLPPTPVIDLALEHASLREPLRSTCNALGYAFDG